MFELQIKNSELHEMLIHFGKVSWIVLIIFFVFVYGGFHPSVGMENYLRMFCRFLIIVINIPSIWKIIVSLLRHGNIELKLIFMTVMQILIPFCFI